MGPIWWRDQCAACPCLTLPSSCQVEIIANDQGNRTTPSYVGFTDNERLIGDAAKNQVITALHQSVLLFTELYCTTIYTARNCSALFQLCIALSICTSLHCTVLHMQCTPLHCIVLQMQCTPLHCTVLHMQYTTRHCTVLDMQCTPLHYTVLHMQYTTLHCTVLNIQCIPLH